MAEQRTITLNLDAVTRTQIAEITSHEKLNSALGYLAGWNMTFPHVTISGGVYDGNPELLAAYRTNADDLRPGYVIGGVWHDDPTGGHFGFHS
jgi:hypothetical protein